MSIISNIGNWAEIRWMNWGLFWIATGMISEKSSLIKSGWPVINTVLAPMPLASIKLSIMDGVWPEREKPITRQFLSKMLVVQAKPSASVRASQMTPKRRVPSFPCQKNRHDPLFQSAGLRAPIFFRQSSPRFVAEFEYSCVGPGGTNHF